MKKSTVALTVIALTGIIAAEAGSVAVVTADTIAGLKVLSNDGQKIVLENGLEVHNEGGKWIGDGVEVTLVPETVIEDVPNKTFDKTPIEQSETVIEDVQNQSYDQIAAEGSETVTAEETTPETDWQAAEQSETVIETVPNEPYDQTPAEGSQTFTETVYNSVYAQIPIEVSETATETVYNSVYDQAPAEVSETFTADVSNRTFEQAPIETGKTVYIETIETPETQWQAVEAGKTTYTETVYNQPTQWTAVETFEPTFIEDVPAAGIDWTAVETFEPSIIAEVSDPIFELTPITGSETVITDGQDSEQDMTAYDDITKPTHIEGSKVKVIAEVDQKDSVQKDSTKSDKHDITKATADTNETKTIALIAGKSSTYVQIDQPDNTQADQNGAESETDTDKMITEIAGDSNIVALPKTGETDSLLSSALSAIGLTLVAGAGVLFFKPRKPIGKHSKR